MEIKTIDAVDVGGKTVLVRVDINSPIDPKTGEILDDTRILRCAPTIRELASKGAKVVVLAHQGRPGDEDFTTLEKHAEKLKDAVGLDVKYVADVLGPTAIDAIRLERPGEIVLLENVRFYAEENLNRPPERQANTFLVRKLAPLAQLYVNDAFAAAHRSQPSLVGFPLVLPAYAGRLMEHEMEGLGKALSPERPSLYVLGGVKVDDSLKIMEHVLERGIADTVLTGGFLGHLFLAASGLNLGKPTLEQLEKKGALKEFDRAKRLLDTKGEKIKVPPDVVVDEGGKPEEIRTEDLPTDFLISDIGSRIVEEYSRSIARARTVVARGPLGIFERPGFERGTLRVLEAMAGSQAFTIIGGGHLVASAQTAGIADRMKHVSTGGGACISFLAGKTLPTIEMLRKTSPHAKI